MHIEAHRDLQRVHLSWQRSGLPDVFDDKAWLCDFGVSICSFAPVKQVN
jgi:hypothetical protein